MLRQWLLHRMERIRLDTVKHWMCINHLNSSANDIWWCVYKDQSGGSN